MRNVRISREILRAEFRADISREMSHGIQKVSTELTTITTRGPDGALIICWQYIDNTTIQDVPRLHALPQPVLCVAQRVRRAPQAKSRPLARGVLAYRK